MVQKPLAFVDIETTGMDVSVHEIIEIGCVLARQDISDGIASFDVLDEFELKVKPERIGDADPQALKVNGYDPERWVFAHTLPEAMEIFADKVGDSVMVGHNVSFDGKFIDTAFAHVGIESPLHYAKLDTFSMGFITLLHEEDIYRYSLRMLCDYFGIEHKDAHTALADAKATFAVYKEIISKNLE